MASKLHPPGVEGERPLIENETSWDMWALGVCLYELETMDDGLPLRSMSL